MSYTQRYSSSINVTGSVNVSYPASETGGTKTVFYEQNVPVNINVTVNTDPFDNSVGMTNNIVDGLTTSVAALNAANCAVIAECSDKISDGIISGFYGLIRNDITTKQTETNTLLQTKSALLLEHSKAVAEKHVRMRSDLERERAKYGMVFSELDKELERRVTELDKPAFNLSRKIRQNIVINPYLSTAADTADRLKHGSTTRNRMAIAGLRQKVSVVLHNLTESLRSNLHYRQMMSDALWSKSIDDSKQYAYIPVAYCIFDDLNSQQKVCSCYTSDNSCKDRILATVNSYVAANGSSARAIPEDETNYIKQAFLNMVQDNYTGIEERSEFQERVYSEIFRMWQADHPDLKQV